MKIKEIQHMFFRKDKKMNILITGSKGQLGSYLYEFFKQKSFLKNSIVGKVFGIDIDDLDIRDANAVSNFFNKNVIDPPIDIDYVIHCAAATDTTAIEKNPNEFYAVNCLGAKNIARSCAYNGIKMIFISSDYVFSEKSPMVQGKYDEFPVNQYGLQKLIAEQFVQNAYAKNPSKCLILRSSWMYGNSRNSFIDKFLKHAFKIYAEDIKNDISKDPFKVKVVNDAYGKPTSVFNIAAMIYGIMLEAKDIHGKLNMHFDRDQITRYDWANMIWNAFVSNGKDNGDELVKKLANSIKIMPVKSSELNISMAHPGKVEDLTAQHSLSLKAYEDETKRYINHNWQRYLDLANEIINGKQENEKVL